MSVLSSGRRRRTMKGEGSAGLVIIGVDLGGTNVRAAAVDRGGRLLTEPVENPSEATAGFDRTLAAIAGTVREAIRAAGLAAPDIGAIGMAVPGHVDGEKGIVRWTPNFGETRAGVFEAWRDVPLGPAVERELGCPVFMGNDANLAALGEYRFGSGRGRAQGLVLLTLGTGIGGGVVLTRTQIQGPAAWERGVLLVGANGGGAELGHTIVLAGGPRCGCGAGGCLEALANRDAVVARARDKLRHAGESRLAERCGGDVGRLTPRLLAEAAAEGDELAREVWDETGEYVGIGVANFINTFNPEVVAIGGQIAKAGEPLFRAIRRAARDHAIPTLFEICRIVPAERIDDAGILGGAALAASLAPRPAT
ncbi:MAG: ROK family protein [Candidatus Rokubacteria bacterium]|nr:ROK family protein [Candidatus Rokubacteria bacterium]